MAIRVCLGRRHGGTLGGSAQPAAPGFPESQEFVIHLRPRKTVMADKKTPRDYSPHQQKIIRRYYDNQGALKHQRLAELVAELYLAEGKKKEKLWEQAAATMEKLGVPKSRIEHLMTQRNPALLAELVKELEAR